MGQATEQMWDKLDNFTNVTDAKGNNYSFEYDNNGNLIKETKALGKLVEYTYDIANQLVEQKDASGNVTSYQYDAVGNLVKETFTSANQTIPNQTVIYQYNDADQLIEVSQSGETNSHFTYIRDKLGRTIRETISYGEGTHNITKALQYTYNADGQLATITYPDNSQVNYHYEKGQLKEVVLANGEKITWIDYNWQAPTQINYPNASQTISYD